MKADNQWLHYLGWRDSPTGGRLGKHIQSRSEECIWRGMKESFWLNSTTLSVWIRTGCGCSLGRRETIAPRFRAQEGTIFFYGGILFFSSYLPLRGSVLQLYLGWPSIIMLCPSAPHVESQPTCYIWNMKSGFLEQIRISSPYRMR